MNVPYKGYFLERKAIVEAGSYYRNKQKTQKSYNSTGIVGSRKWFNAVKDVPFWIKKPVSFAQFSMIKIKTWELYFVCFCMLNFVFVRWILSLYVEFCLCMFNFNQIKLNNHQSIPLHTN